MILNNKGATLPQVLIITSIVGALSVAIMQSVNLANRLKAQNDAALTMDKITNDLTEKLADPEVCGVRYAALDPNAVRGVTNYRHEAGSSIGNFIDNSIDLTPLLSDDSVRVKVAQSGIRNVDNGDIVYTAVGDDLEGTKVDREKRMGSFVSIKEFYFENFSTDGATLDSGELSGNVDLRVVFYKRRSGGIDMLGGAIGSRIIRLRVHLDGNSRIKRCYANADEVTFEGTRQTCAEVGGSFYAGRCFYTPEEHERILKQLCDDMYGVSPTVPSRFDEVTKNCNHPNAGAVCANGIRGFDSTGRIVCQ